MIVAELGAQTRAAQASMRAADRAVQPWCGQGAGVSAETFNRPLSQKNVDEAVEPIDPPLKSEQVGAAFIIRTPLGSGGAANSARNLAR